MEYRKLEDLRKLENNPRKISSEDFQILVKSIKDNPDYFEARPLLLSDRTGELIIIAGNQRYDAAKYLGLKEVPTYLLKGLTEEREREIVIRDNVNNGEWDLDKLSEEWGDLNLADLGLDIELDEPEKEIEEDIAPELDEENEPVSKYGEVYKLGEHRLMCGDSTKLEDVETLMNSQTARVSVEVQLRTTTSKILCYTISSSTHSRRPRVSLIPKRRSTAGLLAVTTLSSERHSKMSAVFIKRN